MDDGLSSATHTQSNKKRAAQKWKNVRCIFQVLKDTLTQLFSYALYLFRYEHYVENQTHSSTHSAQWGLFSSAVWVHKCCHWNMSTALWIAMDSANLSLAAAALAVGCFQVWQQHDLFDLHRAAGWLQTSSPLARIRMRRVSCLFSLFRRNLEAVSFHYMPHAPHHCQQFQTHQYPTYWRPILKLTNFEQRQMWQRVYISPLLFRMGCHCPWLEVYRPVEEQYCVKQKSNAFRIV